MHARAAQTPPNSGLHGSKGRGRPQIVSMDMVGIPIKPTLHAKDSPLAAAMCGGGFDRFQGNHAKMIRKKCCPAIRVRPRRHRRWIRCQVIPFTQPARRHHGSTFESPFVCASGRQSKAIRAKEGEGVSL